MHVVLFMFHDTRSSTPDNVKKYSVTEMRIKACEHSVQQIVYKTHPQGTFKYPGISWDRMY